MKAQMKTAPSIASATSPSLLRHFTSPIKQQRRPTYKPHDSDRQLGFPSHDGRAGLHGLLQVEASRSRASMITNCQSSRSRALVQHLWCDALKSVCRCVSDRKVRVAQQLGQHLAQRHGRLVRNLPRLTTPQTRRIAFVRVHSVRAGTLRSLSRWSLIRASAASEARSRCCGVTVSAERWQGVRLSAKMPHLAKGSHRLISERERKAVLVIIDERGGRASFPSWLRAKIANSAAGRWPSAATRARSGAAFQGRSCPKITQNPGKRALPGPAPSADQFQQQFPYPASQLSIANTHFEQTRCRQAEVSCLAPPEPRLRARAKHLFRYGALHRQLLATAPTSSGEPVEIQPLAQGFSLVAGLAMKVYR